MRLIRWKRIGQSEQELVAAILFSFVIHGLFIAAVLLFSLAASPKVSVPISYQVMLVSAPTEVEPALPQEAPLLSPKPAEVPAQKKTSPKAPAAAAPRAKLPTAAKSSMPDLGASKAAQKKIEQQPEATTEKEKPAAPSVPASPVGAASKKEAVAVSAGQQNQLPGLSGYLPLVREKIARNWNPPPGVREARSKVIFRILRSGRVGDVKLQESSGNFYFDQAANRSIFSSSPFPQLPEEYPREYLEISVDLAEKD
jgi:TonB family protein